MEVGQRPVGGLSISGEVSIKSLCRRPVNIDPLNIEHLNIFFFFFFFFSFLFST